MVTRTCRGFTLIEVLITLSIVFLVGVALFQGYRTAMDASARAAASVTYLSAVEQAEGRIRSALRSGMTDGEWQNRGVHFSWQAELLDNRETMRGFDVESMRVETSGRKVRLYRVTLSHEGGRTEETRMLIPEPQP